MRNSISSVEIPEDFRIELSKNFCAMKYYHQLPKKEKLKIVQKTENLNKQEIKDYVAYLGNIF